MNDEVLVKVDNVSKKFCRSLKRSLFYGLQDIASEMVGRSNHHNNLRKNEFWAVKDVSFELRRGECLGLIGHNGAGKSTLLRMLNGLIKPDQGQISIQGRVGALIQLGAGFNPILTGRENIYVNGQILGFSKKEVNAKFDAIVDFAEIDEFIDTPVQNYSSGMKVRLGFAVAAQMEPDVLLIDEVLAVGDMGFRIKCLNEIQRMLSNAAVIFVTHSMPFISRICNKGILMYHGKTDFQTEQIGDLIERYMSMFNTGDKAILGGDEVEINDIRVYSANGLKENIDHGSPMEISFKLKVSSEYENYFIRIVIFNLEQRPVVDFFSKLNDNLFQNDGNIVEIKVDVPHIYLNPGKYSLSILIIKGDEKKILGRIDNATEILIISDYVSWSETYQPANWKKII